jgi:hypothetical protein
MSEPYWVALGPKASPVDYVGPWAAGTAYVPGQVVRHNGADHIAVNPSTGQEPSAQAVGALPVIGIGTTLPASPFDGQEYILVDSLTVPTYAWRFRYVASITDAYKWVFIGGYAIRSFEATGLNASTSYSVFGPVLGLPRAGIYDVLHTSVMASGGAGPHNFQFWTFTPTAAAIAGAREHRQDTQSGNSYWIISHRDRITIPSVPMTLAVAFKHAGQGNTSIERLYEAIPVRVA